MYIPDTFPNFFPYIFLYSHKLSNNHNKISPIIKKNFQHI